jgi:hypothetical protein
VVFGRAREVLILDLLRHAALWQGSHHALGLHFFEYSSLALHWPSCASSRFPSPRGTFLRESLRQVVHIVKRKRRTKTLIEMEKNLWAA